MALPKFDGKSVFKKAATAGVAAAIATMPFAAAADNDNGLHKVGYQQSADNTVNLDTKILAKNEARKHGALGLVISHGRMANDPNNEFADPREFSNALKHALSKAGIPLRTYYISIPEMGQNKMAMTFTNGYTSQGPMGPAEAQKNIGDVVKEYRRYKQMFVSAAPNPG